VADAYADVGALVLEPVPAESVEEGRRRRRERELALGRRFDSTTEAARVAAEADYAAASAEVDAAERLRMRWTGAVERAYASLADREAQLDDAKELHARLVRDLELDSASVEVPPEAHPGPRRAALEAGARIYRSECDRHGVTYRYVKSGICGACNATRGRRQRITSA
jgi:hypothetical protein